MTTPSQYHPSPVILCTNHRFKNAAPAGNPCADSQEHFHTQTFTVERVLEPGDTEGGEEAGRGCQSTPGQGRGFLHRAETSGHRAFSASDYSWLESRRACLAPGLWDT